MDKRIIKRAVAILLLGSLLLGLLPLAALAAEASSSVGIIGGADGPTAIFVASDPTATVIAIGIAVIAVIAIVAIVMKKRKKK